MSHEDGQAWYGDAVARAVAEGHELGNHGTIDESSAFLAQADFERNFLHCDALLRRLQPGGTAGSGAAQDHRRWFRPGGGMWTQAMLNFVEAQPANNSYGTVL